ncbi:MAG: PqqD family protein [Candidatus Omnitrophica bacterium]|nr:PqqD family protein [Candidatus Omnitrophota bacterium]
MKKLRVKKGKDLIFRKEEEDAFIFTPEDANIRTLNENGAFIWEMIEKKERYDEILKSLCLKYPKVAKNRIKKDLDRFLGELKKRGLIE